MVGALHSRWFVRKVIARTGPSTSTRAPHAAQRDGIMLAGRAGEADQIIAENGAVPTALELARDAAAEVVLGAGAPADAARVQVVSAGEVQRRLVEEDDFPAAPARAVFAGADVGVFAGGADKGEAGQEGLQVQAQMTLGGGLTTAMPGPVEAAGDELILHPAVVRVAF